MTATATITATVQSLPNGKFRYEVRQDGEVVDTRTSAHRYNVIHVQRWAPLGAEGEYGAADKWAPRYSRKPKAAGAKIEYGFCAANIEITEAGA